MIQKKSQILVHLIVLKASNHESWAEKQQITHEILNGYIALRLRTKNYSSDFVKRSVQVYDWMLNNKSDMSSGQVLRKLLKNAFMT